MSQEQFDKAIKWLVVGYLFYAVIYIFRTSFVIEGERFFCLFDDGMISMRYAKNFANGYGLVWNPYEAPVEGFTNLLWVLYMSLFHLLPIPASKVCLPIQLTSAIALSINLWCTVKLGYALSKNYRIALCSGIFAAFYMPLNTWSLQGMEVGILTLLLTSTIWYVVAHYQKGQHSYLPYLLLGFGTLIRTDLIVPALALLSYQAFLKRENRFRFLISAGLVLFFFLALQTGFRLWYYDAPLPNTYYLKMTGFPFLLRFSRGLIKTLDFVWSLNWILFLIPFVWLLFRPTYTKGLMAWVIFGQIAYSTYVGGDAWEWWGGSNRFLCVMMPLYFVFLVLTIAECFAYLQTKWPVQVSISSPIYTGLILLGLLNFNAISGPLSWAEWLQIKTPLYKTNNKHMAELGLLLERITHHTATIGVVWAGTAPYFCNRNFVDLLGKNDPVIAHQPMHIYPGKSKYIIFYPGHLKWDYAYSIGKLQPDIVVELWTQPEDATPYLSPYVKTKIEGFELYLKKDTPHIIEHHRPSS